MNTTVLSSETVQKKVENPGSQLALIREQKGYGREYVAGKLHLRVRIIELLEEDKYDLLPEPVFIKGYLRAYAKLLGVSPETYLDSFNALSIVERKPEKVALWQSKRESRRGEKVVLWASGLIVVTAVVALTFWWQNNNQGQLFFMAKKSQPEVIKEAKVEEKEQEMRLTDITKMQSMFRESPAPDTAEK